MFIVLKEQLTVSVDDLASLQSTYLIFASHIIHRFKAGPHSLQKHS